MSVNLSCRCTLHVLVCMTLMATPAAAADVDLQKASDALHRAVHFFRTHGSAGGGYVYQLSADLQRREGEGRVGDSVAWIQPPGTPSVGMAYLHAYRLTRDPLLLEAAVEAGEALVRGQLVSGGWDNSIEFDPHERLRYAYRVDNPVDLQRRRNTTTFDDDKSQSALRFLMQLDQELQFQHAGIHEAAEYAIDAFLKAQYPNGAWPQRYEGSSQAETSIDPTLEASFPESWPREFPECNYGRFYTLNDNTMGDLIETMLDAWDVYADRRAFDAALRAGDFLLLAQLPPPQPGWAQQYSAAMHPAWARKFEPPAITGSESQGVMLILLRLYRRTGESRFLESLPAALRYYRASLLPDGRLARFYELRTNRPLYFTKDYQLTYSDQDLPTHYAFKVDSKLDRIEQEFVRVQQTPPAELWKPEKPNRPRLTASLQESVASTIKSLDDRGAWVEEGRLRYHGDDDSTRQVIQSRTFCRNILILAQYIAAASESKKTN